MISVPIQSLNIADCGTTGILPSIADQDEIASGIDPDSLDAPVRLAQALEVWHGDHPHFDLQRNYKTLGT